MAAAEGQRTAVLTGATRGIGVAIGRLLREADVRVVGAGTKAEAVGEFDEYIQTDFCNLNDIRACAERVGKLAPDILINNAGINKVQPFVDIDMADFLRIQQVNVTAPFALCQAAIGGMKRRRWGRIVNISSIWGKISREHRASYSASKFALDGMTVALAAEHAADGILANCVAPGFTETDLTRATLGEMGIRDVVAAVPIRRMADVGEIARFVVWLAGPENTYITGQNITIDGGFCRV